MKTITVLAVIILMATLDCVAKTACDEVKIKLCPEQTPKLNDTIAKQLKTDTVEILQIFQYDNWTILYIDTHMADETFIFYNNNPISTNYVAQWSGGARSDEEQEVINWAKTTMPEIPQELANCFAWHVTKDRNLNP